MVSPSIPGCADPAGANIFSLPASFVQKARAPDDKNIIFADEKNFIFHDGTVALRRAMGI
jgi:hypothetical protein